MAQVNNNLFAVGSAGDIADELGTLRAEIKVLKDRQAALEQILKDQHVESANGDLFHVTISYDVATNRVDWRAIAEKFNPSRQLVTAHTKTSVSDRVRVTAMKK